MGDIERGKTPGANSPSPWKSRSVGAEGGLTSITVLMIVIGTGLFLFSVTAYYYHYVLHLQDMGAISTGALHPLIKNDMFKRISPSFNEFSHFVDKTSTSPIDEKHKVVPAPLSSDSIFGKSPINKSLDATSSDPLNAKNVNWDSQDKERFARMAAKRNELEGQHLPTHHLTCPGKELVEFWSDSTLDDWAYETPYKAPAGTPTKYVTFEPDVGGWNNIRMQMELVLVFAAASGRTLVLPPDQPMYLLNKGTGHQKEHSFADFFPFDFIGSRVPVISMEKFIELEAKTGHLVHNKLGKVTYPPPGCDGTSGVEKDKRDQLWDYLRNVTSCPPWKGMKDYLVIPPRPGMNTSTDVSPAEAAEYDRRSRLFAGDKRYGMDRQAKVYDDYWHQQKVIHFISKPAWGYRLLEHFYTYIHFQDPAMDRYYKRFVRDFVHYVDVIFCKAAQIIQSLLDESGGVYSSFHVRRGEFQYKNVKIPAAEMVENIGHLIPEGRLVFVATDERDKTFFDAFRKKWPKLRFLDDYMDMAKLRDINPNYLGMIDALVCTRAEAFFGTWFSTFTGYITRIRGYMHYPDNTTWYTDLEHRDRFQQYEFPRFPFYMRENSISWFGIDEDHKDYWEKYFKAHPYVEDPDPWKKKKNKGAGNNNKKQSGNHENKKNIQAGKHRL